MTLDHSPAIELYTNLIRRGEHTTTTSLLADIGELTAGAWAVLQLHHPNQHGHCTHCTTDTHPVRWRHCPTVLALAHGLGHPWEDDENEEHQP